MRIVLSNSQGDVLEVPIRQDIGDDLFGRMREALPRFGAVRIGELSAYSLLGTLIAVCEPDPRPPTAAQIKFALDIAGRLGVALPPNILQDRAVMGSFLTRYADQARCRSRANDETEVSDGSSCGARSRDA